MSNDKTPLERFMARVESEQARAIAETGKIPAGWIVDVPAPDAVAAREEILRLDHALRLSLHRAERLDAIVIAAGEGLNDLRSQLAERDAELEHVRTQLAGCLTAAEGHGISEETRARDTYYGWSSAYQAVLDLWLAFDAAREEPSDGSE